MDRILVLSATGAGTRRGRFAEHAEEIGWPVIVSISAGPVLRQIALVRPAGVVVLVNAEPKSEPCASLVADLRRYQRQLPIVAVSEIHDDRVEQELRMAGATAYLAGASVAPTDAAELIAAARPPREPPEPVPRAAPARSPPALHGRRVPPRIRGRPSG